MLLDAIKNMICFQLVNITVSGRDAFMRTYVYRLIYLREMKGNESYGLHYLYFILFVFRISLTFILFFATTIENNLGLKLNLQLSFVLYQLN